MKIYVRKYAIPTIIILALITIAVFQELQSTHYRPFSIDSESGCITYYKECDCRGDLIVMESYPPQYRCEGSEACIEINEVVCE